MKLSVICVETMGQGSILDAHAGEGHMGLEDIMEMIIPR